MLSITKKADYGLLFLQSLAEEKTRAHVPLRKIAEDRNLPYKFLSQIAIELKKGGLVESKEGLGGGYRLRKLAKNIHVGEVITLLEGPIAPVGCMRGKACKFAPDCQHREIMAKLANVINKNLSKYSLVDLIRQ